MKADMKEEHMLLLMDYLEGNWHEEKERSLQQLIASGEVDAAELQAWVELYRQTGQLPLPQPSARLNENFYAMLGEWKQENKPALWQRMLSWFRQNPSISLAQLMAAMLLLLLGAGIGYWLNPTRQYQTQIASLSGEVQQMRETMVLTLLEQSSATDRLKAVSISSGMQQADPKIYQALLKTLNADPHVNVRLAALNTLLQYAQDPVVRLGLVESIPQQQSPLVQITLAEAMVKLQENQAVPQLQMLLRQDSLNETARKSIEQSIQVLL